MLDNDVIRERLIDDMKGLFGDDQRRIDHVLEVFNHAQQIRTEEGGSELVVESAAILHDIGIHEAERKYGSSAGKYQEIEGPSIARRIMVKHGITEPDMDHICRIIENHHSARDIDTLEFRIIWDADWLVNLPDVYPEATQDKLATLINKIFKTETGKRNARQLYDESAKSGRKTKLKLYLV